jgi:hypothetical protein
MDVCDQVTDFNYIQALLNVWGSQGTMDQLGYDCIDGTDKNKVNLLDFLNAAVQYKKGTKVSDWCNSCTTIRQTDQGYLTITGALDLKGSSSSTKPLYFKETDVATRGSLRDSAFDIELDKWDNPEWPTVITKTPKNKIRILDSGGNPITNLSIETVPVKDVSKINDNNPSQSNFNEYYYLFIKVNSCNGIPLPVYQYTKDANVSNLPGDKVWPLVGNDGNPLDIQFTGCPDSCNEWEWNSQISMI